ncbi:DUF488 family protein [Leekyejoonella antrihumi]|uniref:DUF488 domain-containing protein n=1 Tax=Leekyejoonella antrihumi TaxID=1660198 RepID=A0A563E955_9MICO|nr:DUF488 domain-containing protein [Leekyejoonella antrihumi]TWP39027.1 DUF488 domain-containing protein [Leekyejoonella antrihumi]
MGDIWTIGHWTCSQESFIGLLDAEHLEVLVDVRAHPGSRRSPQFGRDVMPEWLDRAGIRYVHLPDLGGRRRKQDVEAHLNGGWRNASFKNYADYTLTPAYEAGIGKLAELATDHRAVVMCAEPVPWRCHRLLISNTLTARGWTVRHIVGAAEVRIHRLGQWGAMPTSGAAGQLIYPAQRCRG